MICFSNTAGHLYQIVSNHNPMKFYICQWTLYLVISPMIVVLIYVKSWLSTVFIMLYDNPDYYAPSKLYEMSLWDVHMSSLGSVVGDKVKWKTALNTYIKTLFLIILYVWQVSNLHVFWENADLKLPKKYQKWQLPLSYYFGSCNTCSNAVLCFVEELLPMQQFQKQ